MHAWFCWRISLQNHEKLFQSINPVSIICVSTLLPNYRAKWLKEPNPEAEELFRMVAEVFIYWSKSHVSSSLVNTRFNQVS